MKKIILSAALVVAMMCMGNVAYAATPVKKAAKTEATTTKNAKAKKECKKDCKKACCQKGEKKAAAKPAK